jgi:hypothetical protein
MLLREGGEARSEVAAAAKIEIHGESVGAEQTHGGTVDYSGGGDEGAQAEVRICHRAEARGRCA